MGRLVQLEVSAINLTLSLREQIVRQKICLADEYPAGPFTLLVSDVHWFNGWIRADQEETRLISRREPFNSDPIYNYLKAKRVQLTQPVRISLSTPEQMIQSGAAAPAVTKDLILELLFSLRIDAVDNDVFLGLAITDIVGLPLDVPGVQALKTKIMSMFAPQKIRLDIGQLTGLGGKPVVANADIAAIAQPYPQDINSGHAIIGTDDFFPDRSWVLIRIEVGAYPVSVADWEHFFNAPASARFAAPAKGGFIPHERSWALFTDQVFLTESTKQRIEQGFQSGGKFKLQGGVSSSWSAPDQGGRVFLDFYGKAVDACDRGIFGSSDISVHVNVPIDFAVDPPTQMFVFEPGVLRQNVKVNTWKDDWDTALCIVGVMALWPYLGPKLMEDEKLDMNELMVTFALPPLIAVGALKEGVKGGKVPAPADCQQPDGDKDEFVCRKPFEAGFAAIGALPRLVGLRGRDDGLVLMGDFFWTQRLGRHFHLQEIQPHAFRLATQPMSCGIAGSTGLALISAHPDWFAVYSAAIVVDFELNALPFDNATSAVSTNPNDKIPPYICTVRVRPQDDPLNVFAPYVTVGDFGIGITVPLTAVPAAYWSNPYPCRVLVFTSHGARIVSLPPIKRAAEEEVKKATLGAWAKRVSDCYAKSKRWDYKWLIDPGDLFPELHYWEFVMAGLQPEEPVTVRTGLDREQVEITADHNGRASLQLLLRAADYDGQVHFMRRRAEPTRIPPETHTMQAVEQLRLGDYAAVDVKQAQLLLRAQIQLDQPCRAIAPFALRNREAVAVLLQDKIEVYDLSQLARTQLFAARELQGVHGIVAAGRELIAYGEAGIFAMTMDFDLDAISIERLSRKPVQALAYASGRAYILRSGKLEVWCDRTQCETVLDAADATHLAATSSRLLLGSCNSVRTFEIGAEGCLRAAAEERCEGLEDIATSDLMAGEHEFLLRSKERTLLIDTARPERLTVRGRHSQDLRNYYRYRSLLLQAERGDRQLRVYTIGATATA